MSGIALRKKDVGPTVAELFKKEECINIADVSDSLYQTKFNRCAYSSARKLPVEPCLGFGFGHLTEHHL